jgi:hypothetical protein
MKEAINKNPDNFYVLSSTGKEFETIIYKSSYSEVY